MLSLKCFVIVSQWVRVVLLVDVIFHFGNKRLLIFGIFDFLLIALD